MGDRRAAMYRRALQLVKDAVRRLTHRHWRPMRIMWDFEMALWGAIHFELPAARVSSCYFHFAQCLWRKVQDLGLAEPYRNNERLRTLIRKTMAVGYLPLAFVRLSFQQLLTSDNTQRLIATYPQLDEYLQDYMFRTYVAADARFPPADWNVHRRDMDQRTNNHVESYHRALNQLIGVRHPNLWHFIRSLKDCQAEAEGKLVSAERRDTPSPRRRKWRVLEARIR
ncbi:hypothetical protein ACOMHN_041761 [Nucella lapillus]